MGSDTIRVPAERGMNSEEETRAKGLLLSPPILIVLRAMQVEENSCLAGWLSDGRRAESVSSSKPSVRIASLGPGPGLPPLPPPPLLLSSSPVRCRLSRSPLSLF